MEAINVVLLLILVPLVAWVLKELRRLSEDLRTHMAEEKVLLEARVLIEDLERKHTRDGFALLWAAVNSFNSKLDNVLLGGKHNA